MRTTARILLALTVVVFAAGPVLAVPLSLRGPTPAVSTPIAPASPGRAIAWLVGSGVAVFGITIRKDIGAIANKFATRAQAASGDYKDGVAGAGQKWESNTAASEPAYEGGVQQAINDKRFGKGVAGKGGKFQTNAVNLGAGRYGPGVTNAKDAYARGMAPVISVLSGLSLPPKSFRGSPQNQQRSNAVATALAAMRSQR